jgi:hypothetical protein
VNSDDPAAGILLAAVPFSQVNGFFHTEMRLKPQKVGIFYIFVRNRVILG